MLSSTIAGKNVTWFFLCPSGAGKKEKKFDIRLLEERMRRIVYGKEKCCRIETIMTSQTNSYLLLMWNFIRKQYDIELIA